MAASSLRTLARHHTHSAYAFENFGLDSFTDNNDDGPIQCFNAAKNWQLEWYNDKQIDVTDELTMTAKRYVLNGISDYGDVTTNKYIVIKFGNFFFGFNKKEGMNRGTLKAQNQVTVIERESDKKSKFQAELSVGDDFAVDLGNGLTAEIKYVENTDGKDAIVELRLTSERPVCDSTIEVVIVTDNYAGETTWTLINPLGEEVMKKSGFNTPNTEYTVSSSVMDRLTVARKIKSEKLWRNGFDSISFPQLTLLALFFTSQDTVSGLCADVEYTFLIEDTFGGESRQRYRT